MEAEQGPYELEASVDMYSKTLLNERMNGTSNMASEQKNNTHFLIAQR